MIEKRWYVFDAYDCFDDFASAAEAAAKAEKMVADRLGGIHITCMTKDQFNHYVTHDRLKEAWAAQVWPKK